LELSAARESIGVAAGTETAKRILAELRYADVYSEHSNRLYIYIYIYIIRIYIYIYTYVYIYIYIYIYDTFGGSLSGARESVGVAAVAGSGEIDIQEGKLAGEKSKRGRPAGSKNTNKTLRTGVLACTYNPKRF
jgi:hypothetical protein